jgi:hypothetical protein
MIEFLGLLYTFVKDMKVYLEFNEEKKLVDSDWLVRSGFKEKAESDGWKLAWVRPDRVASLKQDGYEILYEIDKLRRVRRQLVSKDSSVLVAKRQDV